jgi:hypothetical protein
MTMSINAQRLAARTFYRRAVETQRNEKAEAIKNERVAEVAKRRTRTT